MKVCEEKNDLLLSDCACFDLERTLLCGQAFRWRREEDGAFFGVACGRKLRLLQQGNVIRLFDTSLSDYERFWRRYFDLDFDYDGVLRLFCEPGLRRVCSENYGIRILRQEPWEALCSFLLSSNNNIPRIRGITERLCALFGEDLGGAFSFPSAEKIAALSEAELSPLRAGYRTGYVLDAARKVVSGEVNFEAVEEMPLADAEAALRRITGVGPKVAQCVLLYGFGRKEAFPVDVWVKRVLAENYPDGLPPCTDGVCGIAQQYLFYERRSREKEK